jgi:hypothetical protein
MLSLLSLAHVSVPSAPSMLAFGDSWAYLGYDQLKEVFEPLGFKTAMRAIPGTPAGYWALLEPNALIDAIDANNATHVYISLGGNEFLEGLPFDISPYVLYAEMVAAMSRILDKLFAARPNVHVYQFGYEILNWDASAFCRGFGDMELKGSAPLFCPDTTNVTCMTHLQARWLQSNFIDDLGRIYRLKRNTQYHALNLLGTLQVAGGIAGAAVGAPRWDSYSPTQYVRKEDGEWGCVHLTPEGYTALYTELAKHVVRDAPVGAGARLVEQPAAEPAEEGRDEAQYERRPCASNQRRQCSVAVKP